MNPVSKSLRYVRFVKLQFKANLVSCGINLLRGLALVLDLILPLAGLPAFTFLVQPVLLGDFLWWRDLQ